MNYLDVNSAIVQAGSLKSIKTNSLICNELKLPTLTNDKLLKNTSSGVTTTNLYTAGTGISIDGNNVISSSTEIPSEFIFVNEKSDLPAPSGGIITLVANKTYFFVTTVDLTGDRLVCGENTVILGTSSENARIKSTGLASALITSNYSLPMRNIALEASLVLSLNGNSSATTALDWEGVNFVSCADCGTIQNYSNATFFNCAFLNSGNLTFTGTFDTVAFSQCLFTPIALTSAIIVNASAVISRRFRVIYSSISCVATSTGINFSSSATVPDESYILDTVNFSGSGTYLAGLTSTSNDALFVNCKGITNTAVNGQCYFQGNAQSTPAVLNTWYKIRGITSTSADNSKFQPQTTGTLYNMIAQIVPSSEIYVNTLSSLTNVSVGLQIYYQNCSVAGVNGFTETITSVGSGFFITTNSQSVVFSGLATGDWQIRQNRLQCSATISRKYLLQATLSFTSGANNVCEFGFYESMTSSIRTPSRTKSTANASGRAENIALVCAVTMTSGDYIELHARNTTGGTAITVDAMNFMITEIN